MRTLSWQAALVGLTLSILSAGCLSTRDAVVESVQAKTQDNFDASQQLELPQREKAKAQLATAQMLDKGNKVDEAIKLYEMARSLNSSYTHVCRRLAVLYDRQGNFAKANEEYEKAIKLHPRDADLLNDAGYSRYCQGDWTLAEDYLRQAIEIKKDSKKAWVNLGMTLAQRERMDEALEAFTHAISEPEAHCNLAFVYKTQGKPQEAIMEYRKALLLAPNLQIAQEALAKLENPSVKAKTTGVVNTSAATRGPVEEFAAVRDE